MPSFSEAQRRSIKATVDEICIGEATFKAQHGVDIADDEERMEVRDIINRIERKLMARMTDSAEVA
jgi:hypothetical protein